ncbi:MAG: hypothetical protein GX879_08670 [Bacteroidales bacterium]|nr:hypothetical protein [Bacteroidales bacterium]
MNIKFAKQWDINIDFTQEFFPKIRNQLSESYSFLNFSVGKLFFKDKLYSYFKLINAFDESINLTQSISANQYYTSLNNRLGRVFLLGIKYNLRQLDKN